jgi:transcriptional regulator with XRE-family HTH domain
MAVNDWYENCYIMGQVNLEEIVQPAARLFGMRLKDRRKTLGLTQTDIYKRTEITPGYLSLIERGRANPTLDMMLKLAQAVEMEIWEMLRSIPEDAGNSHTPR